MMPYLRFGLVFFASNLVIAAFRRSGETMIRIFAGDYAQVGYFGLAYDIFLTAATVMPFLTLSYAPLFTALLAQGQTEAVRRWSERLLKGLAIGGIMVLFGVLLLGEDLVPLVLGDAYRPVAANLVPLTLALLALALGSVARLLALVHDRPGVALASAVVRLAAFWGLGPLLVAWRGALGGCLAVLAASILYGAYSTWRIRRTLRYSLRPWALTIALAGLFLPLAWLPPLAGVPTLLTGAGLYVTFLAGYGGALLLLRIITPAEIEALWRVIGNNIQPTG
jgi:O-antigen/teichoic acid export membrane protein